MNKKFIWMASIALSFFINQSALAWSGKGCGEGLDMIVQSLKLDDSQKSKIQPILEQLKSSFQSTGAQLDDLDKQLKDQANAADLDINKADGIIDQKAKLIGDMMKAKFNAKTQIAAILNADQKSKLQEQIQKQEDEWALQFKQCKSES